MAEMTNEKTAINGRLLKHFRFVPRLGRQRNQGFLIQLQGLARGKGMEVRERLIEKNLASRIPDQTLRPPAVLKKLDLRQS